MAPAFVTLRILDRENSDAIGKPGLHRICRTAPADSRGVSAKQTEGKTTTMTMEECYQQLGGNYAEVCTRLPSPKLVERFVGKFLEDKSFALLCEAMEAGSREDAFRTAHMLKGVCANLSFTRLMRSASRLTELLRSGTDASVAQAAPLLEEVRRDYQLTVAAIASYKERN